MPSGHARRISMTRTILQVDGMTCSSCVAHVRDALSIAGVTKVEVTLESGTAAIDHEATVSSGRLIAALEQIGYSATSQFASSAPPRRTTGGCCGSC